MSSQHKFAPVQSICKDGLERHIHTLMGARALFERIHAKGEKFRANVRESMPADLRLGGGGKPGSNLVPINPMDEWLDVTNDLASDITALARAGLITVLRIDGRWMARLTDNAR